MPYLGCADCGKTFYTARREPGDERCVECGGEFTMIDAEAGAADELAPSEEG